ncbi:LLM class flavin-dependent oxidoreductase [Actinoplanes sp. M2I2]|uniref:LLM class flavin-dependent oxidoreductase n=1 Tax=Actinoplanes sp. M2I2 TaxID=1734444 RepID=UPI002020A304|nr:LLM class flavin-dependent oxidoreductase [Actinoplanes sp. M2I2]
MRLSLLLPFAPTRPEQAAVFGKLVQSGAAARLWQGQGTTLDAHHLIAWLAGRGIAVPSGFGVSLMPLRSPHQAALEARSTALSTGLPVVAGFGPGSVELQRGVLGGPYPSPLGAARGYLGEVRGLLAGSPSDVELGLGVLRPGMAGLAGEIADVAITWLASAGYLAGALVPAIRAARRSVPGAARVVAIVPVAVAGPGRDAAALAEASCGAHVRAPHYRDMLGRAGVRLTGDAAADARAVIEAGVVVHGRPDEVREQLDAYRLAGVDEVVLNLSGTAALHGPKAAAKDLLTLLRG